MSWVAHWSFFWTQALDSLRIERYCYCNVESGAGSFSSWLSSLLALPSDDSEDSEDEGSRDILTPLTKSCKCSLATILHRFRVPTGYQSNVRAYQNCVKLEGREKHCQSLWWKSLKPKPFACNLLSILQCINPLYFCCSVSLGCKNLNTVLSHTIKCVVGTHAKVSKIQGQAVCNGFRQLGRRDRRWGVLPLFIMYLCEDVTIFKAYHNCSSGTPSSKKIGTAAWNQSVMKLTKKQINEDGSGSVSLIPQEQEDLWHVVNLITLGDHLKASTWR